MSVLVRPARLQDAPFLAWAILTAGRAHHPMGWYDIAIGRSEAERLELVGRMVSAEAPSFWNWRHSLVAEQGGEPVGALSAFPGSAFQGAEVAMAEAMAAMGWDASELEQIWSRGAYVFTCTVNVDMDDWTLENVAVRPEARGRGVAGAMIAEALARGRAAGFGQAQLTCVIGNAPARRAYERAGFTLAEESRHPDFEAASGAPGLARYVRSL
ncbi:MAG: GNAT family N-acetyltransferase [Caulobacteraceae bacterium]